MSYICLDIGTSGCKASVVTENAETIATEREEYGFLFPQKGFVELNPSEIFTKIKRVLKKLSPFAQEVNSISLSSFGEAFVLLDDDDNPLINFITYADNRCSDIVNEITDSISDEELFNITGAYPNQSFSLNKILWIMKYKPEIIEKTKSLCFADEYYNYLLCGRRALDCGTASKSMMFDVKNKKWSGKILEKFGINSKWLCQIADMGEKLGFLNHSIVAETGLPEKIKVILGGHDQCCATLGSAALSPGSMAMVEGSTESLNLVVSDSVFEKKDLIFSRKMCIEPYINGNYIVPGGFLTYGNAIRWFLEIFEKERTWSITKNTDIYSCLERECEKNYTNLIFVPYLSDVNIMNPDVRIPGAYVGISLETRKWEFYMALIQGLNFESRSNYEIMCNMGEPAFQINATGGITKSGLFMQNKADIFQKSIQLLNTSEAGVIGLAIICAVSNHDYDSYEDAIKKFVSIKRTIIPHDDYEDLYEKYKSIKEQLRT